MNNITKTTKVPKSVIKKSWPILFAQATVSVAVAGLMLNMLYISWIIWPEDKLDAMVFPHSLEMGILVTVKLVTLAGMGLFFGMISDRFSRKKMYVFCLIIIGIAKISNGFAQHPSMYVQFLLCHVLLGLGQGGIDPVTNSWSNDSISFDNRSRFFGLLEVTRQGFMVIGMIFSAFLIQIGAWRWYFWSTGGLVLISVVLISLFLKEPARGMAHEELKNVLSDNHKEYKYTLNKDTIKKTIFAPTNMLAFIEGIFTWILFSIAVYMIYPYIQGPPYNVSPVASSMLMVIFGLPGAIIGSIAFSRLSDRLAKKNPRNRIYLIVLSMVMLFVVMLLLFVIPLPEITPEEGENVFNFMGYPVYIVFGILLFSLRAFLSIYNINQSPLLQEINLPEAQGTISSWNQFLETIGFGVGPLISGYILSVSQDYVFTAIAAMSIGIPSLFLWLLANRWLHQDIARIKNILKIRAGELQ